MNNRATSAAILAVAMIGVIVSTFYFVVQPLQEQAEALQIEVVDLRVNNTRLAEQVQGYESNETVKALINENQELRREMKAFRIFFNVTNDDGVIQTRFALNGRTFSTSGGDAAEEITWAAGVGGAQIYLGSGNYTVTRTVNITQSYVGLYGQPSAWLLSSANPNPTVYASSDLHDLTISGLQIVNGGISIK